MTFKFNLSALRGVIAYDAGSELALRRLIKWLAGAFLLVLWLSFVGWMNNYQSAHRENVEEILTRQRNTVVEAVASQFRLSQAFLAGANSLIANNPDVDPRASPDFVDYVQAFQAVTNQSMMIRMVDGDGNLYLVPDGDPQHPINVRDREYFKAGQKLSPGEIFISAPFQGRVTGKWAIAVVTKLSKPSHGINLLFVAIELSVFDSIFNGARMQESGTISLFRRDGILLARSSRSSVPLGTDISQGPLFTQGLSRGDSGMMVSDSPTTDKIRKLLAYDVITDYGLVVVAGIATDDIMRIPRTNVMKIARGLGFLSVIVLVVLWRTLVLLDKLAENRAQLAIQASQDTLTGLMNRRRFLEQCEHAVVRHRRYGENAAFVIVDLDHFKQINDTHGHPAGDAVLKGFAELCGECLRDVDYFGRLGGEEFGLLLPNTAIDGALELSERIRLALQGASFDFGGTPLTITASFGLTQIKPDDQTFDTVYQRSDDALYRAKQMGRNQTCIQA